MKKSKEIIEAERIVEEQILTLPSFNKAFYLENMKTLTYVAVNANFKKEWKNMPLVLCTNHNLHGKIINNGKLVREIAMDDTLAFYSFENNRIYYLKNNLLTNIIAHELCHVASTNPKKNEELSGYHTVGNKGQCSGYALNEGATEWLVQRALFDNDDNSNFYKLEVRIARLLCMAVGQDTFYKAYSEANADILNKKLKKHHVDFSLYDIICPMDYIHETDINGFDIGPDLDLPDEIIEKKIKEVEKFLNKAFNRIQRMIIDVYFAIGIKEATDEQIFEFAYLLMTKNPRNNQFHEQYDYLLENNNDAINYFLNKMLALDKTKGKTLKKIFKPE